MSVRQIVPSVVAQFRQELTALVESTMREELDPEEFGRFVTDLKAVLASAGRRALLGVVLAQDHAGDLFEHGEHRHRFKQVSTKEWLTAFGVVRVDRRYFQPDAGGGGVAPIDVRCGMVGRYMTPDVEEAVALASADLSPTAVRELLGKVMPAPPSAKAIQRTVAEVGQWADDAWEEIEGRVAAETRAPEGDLLVVSADGVNVPLREPGVMTGRPAERPGVRKTDQTPTAWREAGVGTVSIYRAGDGGDRAPERLATRSFARMPEPGMATLFQRQGRAVADLLDAREFREVVVLCDGKPALWKTFGTDPLYEGATQILDFFHAIEHLSRCAEAIFGKRSEAASRWHAKYRARLLEDPVGLDALLRSLRYYRAKLRRGSERRTIVERLIRFFGRNRARMRYAEFRARGLPIGSGVVEAACKSIVGARLKRSGMRWSREGGQHVLNLRTRARSGEWEPLWSSFSQARNNAA